MTKDLRGYIDYLSKSKSLGVVNSKASPDLEISAITDKENRERHTESRSLLFKDVDGYDIPVVTNLMGSFSILKKLFSGFGVSDFL